MQVGIYLIYAQKNFQVMDALWQYQAPANTITKNQVTFCPLHLIFLMEIVEESPINTYVYTHAYIQQACIDPHIHSYVYIYAHAYMYIHTHIQYTYIAVQLFKKKTHALRN